MKIIRSYFEMMLFLFGRLVPDKLKDRWIAGAATGVGVAGIGATTLLSLLGFSAVSHSSGAIIITGVGGYVAGTYGIAAAVALITAPLAIILYIFALVVGLFVLVKRRAKK